jgi:hypothetical protein
MEPPTSRRTIQLYMSATHQSAAMRALIRSFPNRSPSGLPVYVAVPQNCSIRSRQLILVTLGR